MFQRYNIVDVDNAKLAYRRLERLLSQEPAQNAARTLKAPKVLPTREGAKLKIVTY
jgi:hypothetical protein